MAASGARADAEQAGPPLEQRISFLVHTLQARIAMLGNQHFRAHDLNHYSARILVLLLEHEALRTGELVERMVLPQSTISSQLQALHAKRLIRRRRSRSDNRAVMVTLTPAGAELARDCNALSLLVHAQVLRGIPARQARAGLAFLHQVQDRLQVLQEQGQPLVRFHAPSELLQLSNAAASRATATAKGGRR